MLEIEYQEIDYGNNLSSKERRDLEHNLAYSLLNNMLKRYFNIENYTIIKNKNGKPYIDKKGVYFNISHTNGLVACAVSDTEVGIDCEKIDKAYDKRVQKFANRYFVENEINLLESSNFNLCVFFRLWTSKEAIIKRLGGNMSLLKKIDTTKEKAKVITFKNYIISISQ